MTPPADNQGFTSPLPASPEEDSAHRCGTSQDTSCHTCNLYRWYPPLLLLSTIMAGIFCWMYLTKPVFVAPAGSGQPGSVSPAIDHQAPDEGPGEFEPKVAGVPSRLNPEMSSLPGETRGPVPPVSDLQPLNVIRPEKGLFRPFEPGPEAAAPAAGDLASSGVLIDGVGEPIRINRSGPAPAFRIVQQAPEPEDDTANRSPGEEATPEAATEASTFDHSPLLVGTILSPEAAETSPTDPPGGDGTEPDASGGYGIGASFLSEFASPSQEFASIDADEPSLTVVP